MKTKSALGEIVDFDLIRIKEQMANTPASITIKARENFIDNKLKRKLKAASQAQIDKAIGQEVVVETPITADVEEPGEMIDIIPEKKKK